MGVRVREKVKGSGEYWIFIDHKNKRKSKKVGRDRKKAEEAAKLIEAKLTLGDLGVLEQEEPEHLFSEYANLWLEEYVANTLKASTYRGYKSILKKHLEPHFGNRALESLTKSEIRSFLLGKMRDGLSPGRVKRIHSALSGILSQAVEDGIILVNPSSRLTKYLQKKDQSLDNEITPYTATELEKYLDTCRVNFSKHYPLMLTFARTGLRLGEGLGLRWCDIDFNGGFLEVRQSIVDGKVTSSKAGKIRRVLLTPQLISVLKKHRTNEKRKALEIGSTQPLELVFTSSTGTPLDQRNIRARIHYKTCEKAELKRVRIHDLRHSYATIRIGAGHNIADVSKQLGHSSIKITIDTYYHWMPEQGNDQISDLDNLGRSHPSAPYPHPDRPKRKEALTV